MSVSLAKPPQNAATFGEGPHWEVATQSLLYVDMAGKAIHRWNPATDKEEVVKLDIDVRPSLVVPRQSGGYVVTHGTTVSHLEWSSGTLTTLETLDGVDSEVKVAFNDGKCDSRGRLWAANQRVAVAFPPDSRETLGLPDGMTIDTDGNLWVACVLVGKVVCFDPKTGKTLRTIQFPVKGTTSCCFGGENMDEMYVTSAFREQFGEETGGANPPGSIFKVTGLGVKGRPDYVYQDTQ